MSEEPKKTLYLEAYAVSEFGDGPAYAKWNVMQKEVERAHSLQQLCRKLGLSECRIWHDVQWDMEEELCLVGTEMVITVNEFWFTAHPKNADYHVETRAIDMCQLNLRLCDKGRVTYHGNDVEALKEIVEESMAATEE